MYKTIIQIGSHVGNTANDPIFKKIDERTNLFLIEPVPYLFNQLQTNYKNKKSNITFINKAVSDYVGEIELTVPSEKNDFSKLPFWASQLASVNSKHATGHLPNLLVDTIQVKCTTLNEIIKEYNIDTIDLLHTDTEGHDYTILMNYDFKVKPQQILFEYKHMDGIFTVGKKYETLTNRLKSLGYVQMYKNEEDTLFELINLNQDIVYVDSGDTRDAFLSNMKHAMNFTEIGGQLLVNNMHDDVIDKLVELNMIEKHIHSSSYFIIKKLKDIDNYYFLTI